MHYRLAPEHEATLLEIIDRLDPPVRPRKISNKTALRCFVYVLRLNIPWLELPQLMGLSCHHTTLYKRFVTWVKSGIFSKIWSILLEEYATKKIREHPKWFTELVIDSTHIRNVQGHDVLGRNGLDRGRRNTKMSAVCDDDGVVLSCQFYPSNFNDCNTSVPALDQVPAFCIPDNRFWVHLRGDKGYVSSTSRKLLMKRRCHLVVPNKVNQKYHKTKLTPANVRRLKKRSLIEHVFMKHDYFRRLQIRYDHQCANLEAFFCLAFIMDLQHRLNRAREKHETSVSVAARG